MPIHGHASAPWLGKTVLLFTVLFAVACSGAWALSLRVRVSNGIVLLGSADFIADTEQALVLLSQQDPEAYRLVTRFLHVVAAGSRSRVYTGLPITVATVSPRVRQAGSTWYASGLAHEAYHGYLRERRQEKLATWKGQSAELEAVAFQEGVIRRIGGSPKLLRHLEDALESRYWDVPLSLQGW